MANINAILKKIYYDPNNPGSFGGVEALYREGKKEVPSLTLGRVKEFLSGELVYSLHKPVLRRFKRNKIVAEKPFENMQCDLVDMKEFVKQNKGYNYILTAIDVFSKKAFAKPVKAKSAAEVSKAFENILKQHKPFKLMTDEGTEFKNATFRKLMKKYNIQHYFAKNKEVKCAIVERFNRTLKNKMFRYFTLRGSRYYLDVLDKLIDSYNNSYHRSIKMTPNNVNMTNYKSVFQNIYGYPNKREMLKRMSKPILKPKTTVRKRYELKVHDRVYYPNWTDQTYEIYKAVPGQSKPYYFIKDKQGNLLKKRYYSNELQQIKQNLYRVEKILKQKTVRGHKHYFVKWLNHPDSHNSWIPAENISNING